LVRLRADLAGAEAARLAFITSGDPAELPLYEQCAGQIPNDLSELLELTEDNEDGHVDLAQLRPLVERRLGILRESVELAKKDAAGNSAEQQSLTDSGAALTGQIDGILDRAQQQEEELYNQRRLVSQHTYEWERAILAIAFLVTMGIVALIFWTLLMELQERKLAEQVVRKLSGRLLKIQDDERRHIARELHDSLGQLLSGLKMHLDRAVWLAAATGTQRDALKSAVELAQDSINETRTLSYLLHPPLLDEFGFGSAAKWYVEGFVKRSKIAVKVDIPKDFERMPEEIELVLFRVLQESLTNIHRHSGSASAEISARWTAGFVTLRVADHGKGISPELLAKFRKRRGSGGVGLAGMLERVEELGGILELTSDEQGATLRVTIPLNGTHIDDTEALEGIPRGPSGDSNDSQSNLKASAGS
jgi:signal transduction histidine kinase